MLSFNNKIYPRILAGILLLAVILPLSAREINVRGTVTNLDDEPLYRVSIYNAATNKLVGVTNEDGKYLVKIDSEGTLLFSSLGYEEKQVAVRGELTVNVELEPSAVALQEVVVSAKRITDNVVPEPTDIEVKGNYFHIKTRVKIPKELFSTDARMIIQPGIYNVTRGKMIFLSPLVFDGQEYAITQERMYDYDVKQDPLAQYVKIKASSSRKDDLVGYNDSTYVENPNDDFRCDMMVAMENYNRVLYRDTFVIARGVVNPLRFLEYEIPGSAVKNESFFPQPEMQLRDTKGDVNLTFPVNKSQLNLNDGNNREEMNRLIARLRAVENDPNARLKSFSIAGTASPEGNYAKNEQLAQQRMSSAMELVLQELNESTRRQLEIGTKASVETWDRVVALLRADGKSQEADAIQAVIDKYPDDPNRQSRGVVALPFYRPLITEQYLPQLRRVSYELLFSQYRYLTDDEIKELYRENSGDLTRNEFWRLYNMADSKAEREAICRRALEVYPKFLVAATDLAAMLIEQGKPDAELLVPYLGMKEIPDETRLNQVIAWLSVGKFVQADSLAAELPDTGAYHKAKVYSAALNGRYEEVIQEISAESPFNEVLMLLAIKANDQAWEKAKLLGNSARENYIKAVAANRVDEVVLALSYLESAFKKDPSLRDIASIDGDVLDLLQEDE
ncbi:carboxypeptidase-like regulatory domain-containing protein [Barnesiella viscericola]|uniref:Carboxypeptidase-like regulatory domain-containing protein n=1 Tax=Barnesiella viscericola TaxID=397865 RepID=A0A921MQC6_9BACT|nr:carboxypeptidase-like regulatory domain-containing protein [Barnesiella viscericola]HJG88693.1 carboxypeptidase-like regulatory domain-containing protein [Barnesiella viscericola]